MLLNTADRWGGGAFFERFRGFGFFPTPRQSRRPPQRTSQGKYAIPLGKNTLGDDDTNRWALLFVNEGV
jgi:hypothetical protein